MKFFQIVILSLLLAAFVFVAGCDAKAERERARVEQEEKARRDMEMANKAITGMNRRVFGKKPEAGEAPKNDPEASVASEHKQ